jgi:hypothetical protein
VPSPAFTDPDVRPTPKLIAAALGRAALTWTELLDRLRGEVSGLSETWRYYPDGKSWLLKVARRGKTVCWVSVERGRFKVAFYFPARLDVALLESDLSAACKKLIREGKPIGKLRPVPVVIGPRRGVEDVLALARLKLALK